MIPHSAELLDIRLDHLFSIDIDIIHKHNKRYGWRLLPTSETFHNPRHDVGPTRPTPQEPPRPTHLPNPSRALASESPENDRSLDSRATGPQNSSTSTREYKQLYRSLLGFGASRPLFLRVVSLVRSGKVNPKPRRAVSNFQIPVFHTISGQPTFEVLLYISIIGPWTKDGRTDGACRNAFQTSGLYRRRLHGSWRGLIV